MTDIKAILCCGSAEDFCKDISCKVEETEKGFQFSVTSEDPVKAKMLKEKIKSCCKSDDNQQCC